LSHLTQLVEHRNKFFQYC